MHMGVERNQLTCETVRRLRGRDIKLHGRKSVVALMPHTRKVRNLGLKAQSFADVLRTALQASDGDGRGSLCR